MKPIYRYGLSIVLCLVLAVGAYFWATGMVDGMYAYRSPLKDQPPQPGETTGSPQTRRVVFVLIDGLRYDTSQNAAVMPTLAKLRAQGASAKMHSQTPSFSEPGYSTLLTGGWPYLNDGPVFNLAYAEIYPWTQDNLFRAAARSNLRTAVSGYYWFEKLIPQSALGPHFYTPGEDKAADRAVVDAALPMLSDPQNALVLIHLDQVDYAGHHEGGARDPNWNAAAARADGLLAEILAKFDLSRDTILVCSDHGHILQGGHGGQDADVLAEPLVLAGAGISANRTELDAQMTDVAPTIAALLGLNLPASGQGRVLTSMLTIDPETVKKIEGLETVQAEALFTRYAGAIGEPVQVIKLLESGAGFWQSQLVTARDQRLTRERLLRVLPAVILAVLPLIWFVRHRPRGWGWLVLGALLVLVIFNTRYALIDRRVYSFSSLLGAEDLVLYCAVTGAVGFAVSWLLVGWRLGWFSADPLEAAQGSLGLTLVTVWMVSLPVLTHFILNGVGPTWTTPDALSYYLGLLMLVFGLIIAVTGVLFSGVTALLCWLNRRRFAMSKRSPAVQAD